MKANLVVRPAARAELISQYDYIAADNVAAAEAYLDAAEKAFESLAIMPRSGRLWNSATAPLAQLRVFPVPSFENYLIFYRPISGGIEVLHVLHGARDLEALLSEE